MICTQTPITSQLGPIIVVVLATLVFAPPTSAQEVLVQNGATAQVANQGVWHLQGGTMDFGEAGATARLDETAGGRVTGGLLTAIRALNSPSKVDPAGLGAVVTSSANLGDVTVTRGHTVQVASNGNESIERYYEISPSQNNSGLSARLTHRYHDAELNGRSESDLELFKSTDGGTTWSEEGADSGDASSNRVTLSGIDSFSRWTLGSEASPLPVELADFKGTTIENGVRLTWRTAAEQNNAGFRVQRKARADQDGQWTTVGHRDGAGTTDEPQTYRFTDEDLPYASDSLSYRLKQVDVGGAVHTTDPITVERRGVKRLALKKTYPNPAWSQVTVRYAIPDNIDAQHVTVRLYDVLGRQVQTVASSAKAGRHEVQLDVADLASGLYVMRLNARTQTRTRRLTVVR